MPVVGAERYLDRTEDFWRDGAFGNLAIEYRGHLDVEHLKNAFSHLGVRFPMLHAKIVPKGSDARLLTSIERLPEIEVIDGSVRDLLREVNRPRRASEFTCYLVLVRERVSKGYLSLGISHSLVDFVALRAIFGELLSLYTQSAADKLTSVRSNRGALPSPPSEILRDRWSELEPIQDSIRTDFYEATFSKYVPGVCHRIHLTQKETETIRLKRKAYRVSVNALLGSAVMVALRDMKVAVTNDRIHFSEIVNLRRLMAPSPDALDPTILIGTNRVTLDSIGRRDLGAIATLLEAGRKNAIASRKANLPGYSTKHALAIEHTFKDPGLDVHVNNIGIVPLFPNMLGVEVAEFFWPTITGATGAAGDVLMNTTYTYNGRATIFFIYPSKYETAIDKVINLLLNE